MATPHSSKSAPVRAVLFDIDGTLVDSNYLHIEAWTHAFADLKVPVDASRLHRSIGMDSAKLLDALMPSDHPDDIAERAKDLHATYYEQLVPRLRVFENARQLITELGDRGIKVVLATSAPEDELKHLREVLDIEPELAEITSGEEVETAKPDPKIVEIAMHKVAASPADTIMIGDATWDVEAATNAGVPCIGVLTGGYSRAELEEAGAIAVYADVAELLEELERSPLARLWSE
jgi:HAD superfamily hydrolase (TIGR01549 family)